MIEMSEYKLDLLAFGAHPDDVEIGMGATLAWHAEKGYLTGICDLTHAELSSNGSVELRKKEAQAAADTLGVDFRENLGLRDRGLILAEEKIAPIVDAIRFYRPKVIFAPFFEDRHPDHGDCARLVEQAYFSSGIKKYKGNADLPACRPKELYFYFINGFQKADVVLDVSAIYGRKIEALKAYRSQFDPADEKVETPLTSGYIETVRARDRLFGKEADTLFAEGFKTKRPFKCTDFIGDKR